MKEKRDWRDSEFTKHIRVKEKKHDLIKRKRGKKSIAGKLDEIIDFWEENEGKFGYTEE